MCTFVLPPHVIFLALSTGWSIGLKIILTSPGWELEFPTIDLIIEKNYLTETFPQKIGQGIFSKYLMDRECNCSIPFKVNRKCVYEGKFRSECIIYEVKCSICDAIYIGNTHQTFKTRMDGPLSDLLHLFKNGQKSDSVAAHSKQHFKATTSCTDLRKYMTFKLVNQINPIGATKTFTKPNWNLFIEERLTTLKNLHDKCVTIMNKNSEIYGAYRHKTTFYQFFLSTDDPIFVFNRWKG